MAQEIDKGLNLSILKSSLAEDDFGILNSPNQEIDSIESLENIATPVTSITPVAAPATTPVTTAPIAEITEEDDEEIVPEPPVAQVNATDKTKDLLKVFGANLADSGVIDFKEEDFDKAEDKDEYFQTQVSESIKRGVEEGIKAKQAEWPEEVEKLVELAKSGVPLHSILEADSRIASLEGIKAADIEADVDLQRDILRELYTAQGFSKERIDAKIKRAEDLSTLKDDSLDGLDILVDMEKRQKEGMIKAEQAKHAQAEQARLDKLKSIEDSIKSTDEIIPGFKLTDEDKKTLINGITKATAVDKTGRPINALAKARIDDPKMDLKVAYFTLVLKGDLSKLQTKATTKATRTLKSILDTQEPITGSGLGSAGTGTNNASKVDKDVFRNSLRALKRNT